MNTNIKNVMNPKSSIRMADVELNVLIDALARLTRTAYSKDQPHIRAIRVELAVREGNHEMADMLRGL